MAFKLGLEIARTVLQFVSSVGLLHNLHIRAPGKAVCGLSHLMVYNPAVLRVPAQPLSANSHYLECLVIKLTW